MVQGIFEIQLVTASFGEMVNFYQEVIGLSVLLHDDNRGRLHFSLGTGQLILAQEHGEQVLAEWPGVPPRMYEDGDATVPGPVRHGPVHYAFHVDDDQWSRIEARLEENAPAAHSDDATCVATRGPFVWGAGFRSLYFRDPDGNCVELICEV